MIEVLRSTIRLIILTGMFSSCWHKIGGQSILWYLEDARRVRWLQGRE